LVVRAMKIDAQRKWLAALLLIGGGGGGAAVYFRTALQQFVLEKAPVPIAHVDNAEVRQRRSYWRRRWQRQHP